MGCRVKIIGRKEKEGGGGYLLPFKDTVGEREIRVSHSWVRGWDYG